MTNDMTNPATPDDDYRKRLPEELREDYDRLRRRMTAQAAFSLTRERARRRAAQAFIPEAEAIVAEVRRW
ncbi:hypothetical protein [Microbacterium sp. USTB-Y]|uniref:hypothetical protein n=1 Tax=Microbacterium sp. USTB-Y TaxID=2823692 RepID=UPI00203FA390|nr:hypothetical protein [Microbacterium sp. USTB-Y]